MPFFLTTCGQCAYSEYTAQEYSPLLNAIEGLNPHLLHCAVYMFSQMFTQLLNSIIITYYLLINSRNNYPHTQTKSERNKRNEQVIV